MNVVIIEDEIQAAWDIQSCLRSLRPQVVVQAVLDSVESALEWFAANQAPDLIICDIQLGDGLVFGVFTRIEIRCPVIFCTAYNEYAIQAFQNNGVDYLLKPINEQLFEKSLSKLESMARTFTPGYDIAHLHGVIQAIYSGGSRYKSNFLIPFRNQLIPVSVDMIALFRVEAQGTEVVTKDGQKYSFAKPLDYIESIVDPRLFYRANRQHLIAYSAIRQIEHYDERKLLVKFCQNILEPIIISKAKSPDFLHWVENR